MWEKQTNIQHKALTSSSLKQNKECNILQITWRDEIEILTLAKKTNSYTYTQRQKNIPSEIANTVQYI